MNDEKNVSLKEATAESTKVEENEAAQVSNFKEKKEEEISTAKKVQNFFITTLNGMAYGLFATLIIGTILQTIGNFFKDGAATNAFCDFMYSIISKPLTDGRMGIAVVLQNLTGAGIGVGIAIALKKKPLETIVLGAVGEITAALSLSTKFVTTLQVPGGAAFQIGDPLTIYLTVISVALLMKLVLVKKTPVDILIVPLFAIVTGLIIGALVRFPAIYVTYGVQFIVGWSTLRVPFVMGVLIAVLMGIALTAPISSAAIAAMVFATATDGALSEGLLIASGAAVVGCSCQMVGFAVQSRKDNPVGMVISIAIGTSMLQFKNIMKRPVIWLPSIMASAILGPISTCWLKLGCMGSSAGMGTSGLVGQIGTFTTMGNTWQTWVGIFGLEIILPALLVFGFDILFRKIEWVKPGDLKV